MFKRGLVLVILVSLLLSGFPAATLAQDGDTQFIEYQGQELFLNGINLAWMSFARDLKDFNETTWLAVIDDIASAHGNTVRWWLHVDGSSSPIYGDDGKVIGLGEDDIKNFKRAVDLAYERGVLVLPTLWSMDMLKEKEGVSAEWNKLLIEDPEYTQAYIDNALTPLVTALAGHPGIIAWEIANEPEGMDESFGWTEYRTTMPYIQQWVNLLAGAIHRADPTAKVTNGSWCMRVLTDVGGFTNYYTDERLIAAGGDELGTLDFYQAHFYQEHFGDDLSPFHNPASYWELDKPLLIGEFPAAGIKDLGQGYRPEGRILRNSIEAYQYLYENGYAGALAWTYYGDSSFGKMLDAKPGLFTIFNIAPERVAVDVGDVDHIPVIQAQIENVFVSNDTEAVEATNLKDVFEDAEDGDNLSYEITQNTNAELVTPSITESGTVLLAFAVGSTGSANLEVTATDSAGHTTSAEFVVQVSDPNRGNVAMGKPTTASTLESQAYLAENATDGLDDTRWSTEYADDQYLMVDLEGVFEIGQFVLTWETAYGKHYELQVWDGTAWQTVFTETVSDGDIDDITLDEPVLARYVRMHGIERGTQWGFSLWEFEVLGVKAEGDFAALETPPPSDMPAAEPEAEEVAGPVVEEASLLYSFEDDAQGWIVVDYWTAIKTVEQSAEMGSEGTASLKLSGTFSGTGWEEGGAVIGLEEGTDWSKYDAVTIDVYVPEGAVDFISQIFMKTGAEWTWANTPDTPLVPGEWNTLTATLADMGNPAEVHELGIKIGTGMTKFEGDFGIDNVSLVDLAESAAEPEPSGQPQSSAMMLYGFEDDLDGWGMADYWAAGTGLEQSGEMVSEGSAALKLTGAFGGKEWQEMGVYLDPPDGADWSSWGTLTVDVFVPEGADGFLAQIFMKTGDDWTWVNTPDIPLVPGEWNTPYGQKTPSTGKTVADQPHAIW